MKVDSELIALVETAARRGARTVTTRIQVARDAGERALAVFARRLIAGEPGIGDLESWAFRVGANAARRSGQANKVVPLDAAEQEAPSAPDVEVDGQTADAGESERRAALARVKKMLTGPQFLAVSILTRRGMTQALAARLLGVDRRNLARTFTRALARIERGQDGPIPPS